MIILLPLTIFMVALFISLLGIPYIRVITPKNIGGRRAVCVRVGYSHLVTNEGRYWEYIW